MLDQGDRVRHPLVAVVVADVGRGRAAATGSLPTASMTPLPAASGQLTGTALQSVLLPASDFPSGYTASSSGATTSGGSLTSGAAQYPLATISCSNFVQHLGSTGFGETGMAADSVVGTNQAYDQVIYQFPTASEASGVRDPGSSRSRAGARRSRRPGIGSSATATFSLKATPGEGWPACPPSSCCRSGTVAGSAVTVDTLFCANGVDVFAAANVGLGVGAPAVPAKATIIYDLMKRQAAAAVLG